MALTLETFAPSVGTVSGGERGIKVGFAIRKDGTYAVWDNIGGANGSCKVGLYDQANVNALLELTSGAGELMPGNATGGAELANVAVFGAKAYSGISGSDVLFVRIDVTWSDGVSPESDFWLVALPAWH